MTKVTAAASEVNPSQLTSDKRTEPRKLTARQIERRNSASLASNILTYVLAAASEIEGLHARAYPYGEGKDAERHEVNQSALDAMFRLVNAMDCAHALQVCGESVTRSIADGVSK